MELLSRRGALLGIRLRRSGAGEPPLGAVHNRGDHLQIADQFGGGPSRNFLLPLRFEKQRRIIQNAFADGGRSLPPGGIQLAGLACIAAMLGKYRRHPLAVLQALPRHRHQKLHRHLRRDLALAHLLLDRFWQQFHQCQPPAHPAHAAIEPPRQLLQAVAETLFHLRQQPPCLQRGFVFGQAQRAVQQHRGGLAHRPYHRFHRVPPQLLQRGDPLVAVDDYVAVRLSLGSDHHDRRLLTAISQGGQQPPLSPRVAHTQMLPTPVELMKLQLHRQAECKASLAGDQYVTD